MYFLFLGRRYPGTKETGYDLMRPDLIRKPTKLMFVCNKHCSRRQGATPATPGTKVRTNKMVLTNKLHTYLFK